MVKKTAKESTGHLPFKYLGNKKETIGVFLLLNSLIDSWNINPKILGCLEAAWLSYTQIPCSTNLLRFKIEHYRVTVFI